MLWISYGKNRYKKIAVTEKAIVVSLQVKNYKTKLPWELFPNISQGCNC